MNKSREKILGGLLIVFAFLIVAAVALRGAYLFNHSARDYPWWFIFYRFTYLTSYALCIFFFLLGICLIFSSSKKIERLKKFLTNSKLLIALTIYATILLIYFAIAAPFGAIYWGTGEFFIQRNTMRFFAYIFAPILMWTVFLTAKRQDKKSNKLLPSIMATLTFPIAYFALNMIIGHTLVFNERTPAFAYAALNPAFWQSSFVFALLMLAAMVAFIAVNILFYKLNSRIIKRFEMKIK